MEWNGIKNLLINKLINKLTINNIGKIVINFYFNVILYFIVILEKWWFGFIFRIQFIETIL